MPNITLSLDEQLLRDARHYSQQHHTTLNALVRRQLEATVRPRARADHVRRLFELMDKAVAQTKGWKWNREEIYAERLSRLR
jgi:hypothetical protein